MSLSRHALDNWQDWPDGEPTRRFAGELENCLGSLGWWRPVPRSERRRLRAPLPAPALSRPGPVVAAAAIVSQPACPRDPPAPRARAPARRVPRPLPPDGPAAGRRAQPLLGLRLRRGHDVRGAARQAHVGATSREGLPRRRGAVAATPRRRRVRGAVAAPPRRGRFAAAEWSRRRSGLVASTNGVVASTPRRGRYSA